MNGKVGETMVALQEVISLLEGIASVKLEKDEELGENLAISRDRVVALAPEGAWERKLGAGKLVEVSIADFFPEVVRYGTEVVHVVFYLKYRFPKPVYDTLHGREVQEVSYRAIPLLAAIHVIKRLYGRVHLYLNSERPAPIIVRPNPLGQNKGFEIVIAPRIP